MEKKTLKTTDLSKKKNKIQSSKVLGKVHINIENTTKKRKSSFDNEENSPCSPSSPPVKTVSSVPGASDKKKKNKFIPNDIKLIEDDISLDILKKEFDSYPEGFNSLKSLGSVKSYGYNSYHGIIKEENEDRLIVVEQIKRPTNNLMKTWPKMSYFAIFDGHGGENCSTFLAKNLLGYIKENEFFPFDIKKAMEEAFEKAEEEYYLQYVCKPEESVDNSGSCALVIIICENILYVANTGDSRAVMSVSNGNKIKPLTSDHKPNEPKEFERVKKLGGKIYIDTGEDGPHRFIDSLKDFDLNLNEGATLREYPSGLAVLRTIGDIKSKKKEYGGVPGCIICTPDVEIFDLTGTDDFIVMGCDGIFDELSNNEVISAVWFIFKHLSKSKNYNLHELTKDASNMVIKYGMDKLSSDNMSCIVIGLEGLEKFLKSKQSKDRVHSAMSDSKKGKGDKKG